jgi:ribonuclease HI
MDRMPTDEDLHLLPQRSLMQAPAPHYLLLTDSIVRTCQTQEWRFVLQGTNGGERIVASDTEVDADNVRLALLAVVRGLEALDGPSRVTLVVANRSVRRGIRRDLAQWRESGWQWERFGQMVPIRDLDLWQRVDRVLAIHQVDCFAWDADEQDSCSAEAGDQSIGGQVAVGEHAPEVIHHHVPRRGADRTYPQRRQAVPAARQTNGWSQSMLDSIPGLGRTALSRSA